MLVFDCTQAAAAFFSAKVNGKTVSRAQQPPSPDPVGNTEVLTGVDGSRPPLSLWQLHALTLRRKSVLLAMHGETRFAMVFVGTARNDLADFVQAFIERWLNEMLRLGMDIGVLREADLPAIFANFMQLHRDFRLYQRSDRSVQAHINQVLGEFRYQVDEIGGLPATVPEAAGFDEWVNGQLRKIGAKGDYYQPDEAMFLHWWAQFGPAGRATAEQITSAFQRKRQAQSMSGQRL
jgi:hypothetical protein